jgi:hypothetical protein
MRHGGEREREREREGEGEGEKGSESLRGSVENLFFANKSFTVMLL